MQLFPCIDLLGGQCVRLRKGRLADVTVYDHDPLERARRFQAAGAVWVHVVDLDAALDTGTNNRQIIRAIAQDIGLRVQTGGGLREADLVQRALDAGAARVVLGTAAVENPTLVASLAQRYPGQIVAAVDAVQGEVAIRGWTQGSGISAPDLACRLADAGVAALLATEVSRDGMLVGPDLGGTEALLAAVDIPILASGGVSSLADLLALTRLEVVGRRVTGAVVGKALYDGRFSLEEALALLSDPSSVDTVDTVSDMAVDLEGRGERDVAGDVVDSDMTSPTRTSSTREKGKDR